MSVDTQHPDYQRFIGRQVDCRVAIAGGRVVKEGEERYLPRPGAQDDKQYEAYKQRAVWFGATKIAVATSVGALFRKPVILKPDMETFDNLMVGGITFNTFIKEASTEVVSVGRVGTLADVVLDGEVFIVLYKAEDIINWSERIEGGVHILELVVLREIFFVHDRADDFEHIAIIQFRVLDMLDGS